MEEILYCFLMVSFILIFADALDSTYPSDISLDRYLDDSVLDISPLDCSDITSGIPHDVTTAAAAGETSCDDIIDVTTHSVLDTAMVVTSPCRIKRPSKCHKRRGDENRPSMTSVAWKLMKTPVISRTAQKVCLLLLH